MRLVFIITFLVISTVVAKVANAELKTTQPRYYEFVDLLTTEQHLPLLEAWLEEQSLSPEQSSVVSAIKAYKGGQLDQGVEILGKMLATTQLPEAHYWAGRLYGQQASEASVFKAGDLADSALKHFQRSVELDASFIEGHQALVQYYIRAPFFAGGSIKKAQQTADTIEEINTIDGILAHMQIAGSEDDDKALSKLVARLTSELEQQTSNDVSSRDNHQLAGYFFTAGMTHMQAENYTQSRKNLDTALSLSHQASSQYSTDLNATKASILNEVQKTNLSNLQQGIRYQLGRLGVISEQDIKLSIHALNDFITGPSHPSYEAHWANLRLAQLLHLDGQISKAKELVTRLPDIDNGQYSKLKKKLMRKLR